MMRAIGKLLGGVVACGLMLHGYAQAATAEQIGKAAAIDGARIIAAETEPGNWLAHGRTYSEQRFSPLDSINADNVKQLGLAWHLDLGTDRGIEATPIVVDGIMFFSGPWSVVWAVDARSGEEIWFYDPEVPKEWGQKACCDVVNRGVAVWDGRVYVGTIDGRLVALDAKTGTQVWDVNTIDRSRPYTITGAPRVVKGKVLIGNGGAELGVRGYVSAYDAKTGELAWRFYTVPGDPSQPFENPELEAAAKTWSGGEWWKIGGGGTVWDSMAYDPELDLLYVGVGNGSPWSRHHRSPGGGDNLFLSSILALRPDTGQLVWHYQTTPGDSWDYTATQHMILADLELFGETRKVLMQAPKNGFFYILDRATGELLSADKYVLANWASHVDLSTGRPVETGDGDYSTENKIVYPSPAGGHNWPPMSYSPQTGLVYIPAMEFPGLYGPEDDFVYRPGFWNTASALHLTRDAAPGDLKGRLIAWDPVRGKARWKVEHWGHWNSGLLSTAGNLVFQGTGDGFFRAFRADTGEELWNAPAQTGVVGSPVTYLVDGQQYVSVLAGWGGVGTIYGRAAKAAGVTHIGRLLTFKVGGTDALPPKTAEAELPTPPAFEGTMEDVAAGEDLFHRNCGTCHGFAAVGGGMIPDLRHSQPEIFDNWQEIVRGGMLKDRGMASFDKWVSAEEAEKIKTYVIYRAHEGDVPGVGIKK